MNRRDVLALAAGAAFGAGTSRAPAAPAGVALVLGGGGCRGHGHIGVIRVLENSGLKPDLVVGSSAGSLVGALYAAGMTSEQIERYGQQLSSNLLRDWIFPKLGLFGGDAIRRFVVERVGPLMIESLPMRFAAVATDLKSGEAAIFDRGDLGLAVQASSSIPGLIEPVRIGERLYVDGNLAAPVPVRAARRLSARRVIAVDVTFPPEQANLGDPFDALYQGFSILTRRLALEERATADIVIAPQLPEHNDMGSATLKSLVEAGERTALEALPKLRALFAATAG
jgi:NTE family protein